MSFRVVVLGSGTIVPSAERRGPAIFVEVGGEGLLLDCGPGALDALERRGVSFRSLDRVLLTHYHPDHTLDVGRLLAARNAGAGPDAGSVLRLYGPAGLTGFVERLQALYASTSPERYTLELVETGPGLVPCGAQAVVRACKADHRGRSALAYSIERNGRRLVYTGDTAPSEEIEEFARGADLLLAECSFPNGERVEGHLTPASAGLVARKAGVRRLVLVHLYPAFAGIDPAAEARKHCGVIVETASDGLEIALES